MAQFQNMIITRAGLDMIAQSQAGGTLIFTKGKLGDGQIGDQSIPDLTDLINAKMSVELSSVTAKTEGHVEVRFIVDNTDLDVGFFVREVGIFAKVNEEGEEKLYGYANAGNYTNYLADKTVPIDSIITKIDLAVGNASNIAFTTDKSVVYVTLEDLEEAINAHNIDEDAHEAAFNKHNADPNAHADFIGATSSAAGKRGMVPAPAKGNNNRYLKSDGTWGEIDTMQGATSGAAGKSGLVPVPTAGANNRYLSADGTWKTISGMQGASASAAGAAGLVPAPAKGEDDEFLRGDGTWQPISNMKGASSNAAGASGLVPAPAKGDQNKALFGDATYKQVVQKVNGVAADNEGDVSLRNALYCHDASEFMEELGTAGWNSKGVYAVTFANTDNFPQKPSPYCVVFNLAETSTNGYAIQIAVNILNGDIYVRGTNNQKEIDDVPFEKLVKNSELLAMLPVGTILPFAGGTIPSGFLATNGAAVSRTTYSALYSAIGTTYGSGDGSTTFNLPQIEDNRFLEFASTAGTKKNAGLPNITGTFRYDVYAAGRTGAFSTGSANDFRTGASQTGEVGQDIQTVFDASDSNSIYGGSTTVQPKSLTVRAIIKY